jgi:hypothetical protein
MDIIGSGVLVLSALLGIRLRSGGFLRVVWSLHHRLLLTRAAVPATVRAIMTHGRGTQHSYDLLRLSFHPKHTPCPSARRPAPCLHVPCRRHPEMTTRLARGYVLWTA